MLRTRFATGAVAAGLGVILLSAAAFAPERHHRSGQGFERPRLSKQPNFKLS